MLAASTVTQPAGIFKLPPEILLQIIPYPLDEADPSDVTQLCHVCKSWLPIAQANLYRSVTLVSFMIRKFVATIEENTHLAPLVKHLTLDPWGLRSDWVAVHEILQVLSPHQRLLSLRIPSLTYIEREVNQFNKSIPLLSFLGHLSIDVQFFENLHAMKQFLTYFPKLHTLDVNDIHNLSMADEWFDEPASDVPPPFPRTIRTLGYYISSQQMLEACLRWIPHQQDHIQSFTVTIRDSNRGAMLGSTLRSLGTVLTSLKLICQGPTEPPALDLSYNTSLRSLVISATPLEEWADGMNMYFSTLLRTLSSPSLARVEFNVAVIFPVCHFMDWGLLDKAAGSANVLIFVSCSHGRDMVGLEGEIAAQMPQHLGQRRVQFFVSSSFP